MTHGVGGLSGGGGGGFSGGGGGFSSGGFNTSSALYSHTHYHSSYSTRGSGTSSGEECDCSCCVVCCTFGINILSFLLCIHSMSRIARVTLLWCYVITVVMTVSLVLSLSVFGSDSFESAATDMRTVGKLSNVMCDSVTVKSSNPFSAYLFDREPEISATQRQDFNITRSMTIQTDQYEYWGFYLLKGSKITINTTHLSSGKLDLYVIQGSSNLSNWISDNQCSKCYITDRYIFYVPNIYTLNVVTSDDYYFVYANSYFYDARVESTFQLQRSLYDVTDAQLNCSAKVIDSRFQCSFDLSLGSSQSVVFHNGQHETDDTINTLTFCHARVSMYVVFFLLLPVSVGVAVSILIWKFCERKGRKGEEEAKTFDPEEKDKSYNTMAQKMMTL